MYGQLQMQRLGKVFDRLNNALAAVAGSAILFMVIAVSSDVGTRYLLGWSQMWLLEVCEYILLLITFFGAAWALKKDAHVKVDIVVTYLRPKHQAALNAVTSFISSAVFLVITWYGVKITFRLIDSGYMFNSPLNIPQWPIYTIVPIGSFLFCIQFVRRAIQYVVIWKST